MNDTQRHNKNGPGLSRRDFLRGSGAAAAATALAEAPAALTRAAEADTTDVVAMGPRPIELKLDVNGATMTARVEPRVTLRDALRNYLDVTGCKPVCDRGTRGARTAMVARRAAYAGPTF